VPFGFSWVAFNILTGLDTFAWAGGESFTGLLGAGAGAMGAFQVVESA